MLGIDLSKFPLLQGRDVKLDEFPSLLELEGHTGGFAAAFTLAWTLYAALTIGPVGSIYRLISPFVVIAALFASFWFLSWLSFSLSGRYTRQIGTSSAKPGLQTALEYNVRAWVLSLSMAYVILCAALIWLTGGATSPFVPFYVMVFTLTIPKIQNPKRGFYALIFFLMAILVACVMPWMGATLISQPDMARIESSKYQYMMYLLFVCASLGVPTYSAYKTQGTA